MIRLTTVVTMVITFIEYEKKEAAVSQFILKSADDCGIAVVERNANKLEFP